MIEIVIHGADLAGGLGVATVAVDGYTKALDLTHEDGETFTLVVSSTVVSSTAAMTSRGVRNMITGEVSVNLIVILRCDLEFANSMEGGEVSYQRLPLYTVEIVARSLV